MKLIRLVERLRNLKNLGECNNLNILLCFISFLNLNYCELFNFTSFVDIRQSFFCYVPLEMRSCEIPVVNKRFKNC